jgi:hypothetical protein
MYLIGYVTRSPEFRQHLREDVRMTKLDRALALSNAQDAIANPDNPELLAAGVRTSLQWFAEQHPGQAVEVRVPPYLAIQILGGTTHRRGTPPAVVEMSPQTWLELFTKELSWAEAVASGRIIASGERSDLGSIL